MSHLGFVTVDQKDRGVGSQGERLAVEFADQGTSVIDLARGEVGEQAREGGRGMERGVVGVEGVESLGFIGGDVGEVFNDSVFCRVRVG